MATRNAKTQGDMLKERGWSEPQGERLPISKWEKGRIVQGALGVKKKLPDTIDGKGNVEKTGGHIFNIALTDDDDQPTGERLCFGAPTLLWEIIEATPEGTLVWIHCTGQVKTRRGQPAWTFEVRHKGVPTLL